MIYVGSAPAQLLTDRTNLFTYMLMQILMVMMMVEMVRDVSFGPHFGHNELFFGANIVCLPPTQTNRKQI